MFDFETELQKQIEMINLEVGVSSWVKISQKKINEFADITGDPQFIHLDPVRAKKETQFGGSIAHGFLILSLASYFAIEVFPSDSNNLIRINYGFDKVRFINPVLSGSEIRGRFITTKVEKRGLSGILQTFQMTIEIKKKEKPAIVADWLTLTEYN